MSIAAEEWHHYQPIRLESSQYYEPISKLCRSMGLQTNNNCSKIKCPNAQTWQDKQPDALRLPPNGWCCYFLWMAFVLCELTGLAICLCWHVKECISCHSRPCSVFPHLPIVFFHLHLSLFPKLQPLTLYHYSSHYKTHSQKQRCLHKPACYR